MLWVTVGFSLCFGSDIGGIIGNPSDFFLMRSIGAGAIYEGLEIPVYLFAAYQLMFAVITPALITGAFANRMTFKAYCTFLVGWQLLVPARLGSWTLSSGASILFLGNNLEAINGGDRSEVILSLGLGVAF